MMEGVGRTSGVTVDGKWRKKQQAPPGFLFFSFDIGDCGGLARAVDFPKATHSRGEISTRAWPPLVSAACHSFSEDAALEKWEQPPPY
jgi:hypothetical protein